MCFNEQLRLGEKSFQYYFEISPVVKKDERYYQSIMKRKLDTIVIFMTIALSVFLFFYNNNDVNKLNKAGVYILGKLAYSTSQGEMSWVYYYKYRFNGKEYMRNFTGPIKAGILKDSLMFFKILPDDPSVCRQLSDIRIPKCLSLNSVPIKGWSVLPKATICDSVSH